MKRTAIGLFIIIFGFGLGVAATLLYLKFSASDIRKPETAPNLSLLSNENVPPVLPVLGFCELAENPEKYNGKIVRLSGKLTFGLEDAWFSDLNCGADNAAVVPFFDEKVWNSIKKAREREDENFSANELNVIVVGKFKHEVYKDCCLIAPFQFEISEVEKVSKTN
jgi:hypothetical protein